MNPRFYFATCQAGAEKAVKAEIAAEHPRLRFAFSRPGFVTFKDETDEIRPLPLNKGIFTRLWGEIVGQARDREGLPALLALIPPGKIAQYFDRDEPGPEPEEAERNGRMEDILKDQAGISWNGVPLPGDEVYSLIWVDDFHLFLGRHVHSERLTGYPGNMPRIPLSAESPSRAYLKIEEAFCRFKPTLEAGMRALEVGCAPGGATTALLKRGLSVTGVDPQRMDEGVAASPAFSFIRKPARFLCAADLADVNPDVLVMDMSIAPKDAINELTHVISLLRANFGRELRLRQGFLTLKLTDWKLAAEIPSYLKRLEALGFHGLRPIQLCSNRQEFFVWSSRFK
jgi:23S rRNA (cytidine2498-2'-O)-methyltransferase